MKWSKFTVTDIAILIAAAVLCICFLVSGKVLAAAYPLVIGILILEWKRLRETRKRFSHTLPATARIVDYHMKKHSTFKRIGSNEVYYVRRPVVEFETERGTVRADYPVYCKGQWFSFDKEYEIHYCPEQLEYFYFADRRGERVNEAEGSLYALVLFAVAYILALPYCLMNA